MKAIIDGKRYDTSTAELIAEASGGRGYSPKRDFHRWEEVLYRTAKGAWFLHGCGGALTTYAEQCGDGMTWGETIRVLTADEARAWLELFNHVDAIERYFPTEVEDA